MALKEQKTFKGHRGKEELLRREGKENQREQRRASGAECLSGNGAQCQMMQRVRMEWTGNCGIWQQDVCLGSVAAGLRGVLGNDVEVREWGQPHVFQEAWF